MCIRDSSYNAEIEILNRYLPEQLSREKVLEIVKETAASLGIEGGKQNMGKLMGPVMGKVKGCHLYTSRCV